MNELNYENLIFFDLETSGLNPLRHEIIQIAAIDGRTGDEFMERVDFDIDRADQTALEKNSFDEKTWNRYAITQEEAAKRFSSFLREHSHLERLSKKGKSYNLSALAGFNILSFDKFFLSNMFEREGIFLPADYRMFDVYQLCLWKFPGLEKYSLEQMSSLLNIKVEFHDALEDARATKEIFKRIISEPLTFKVEDWMK